MEPTGHVIVSKELFQELVNHAADSMLTNLTIEWGEPFADEFYKEDWYSPVVKEGRTIVFDF